MAKVILIGLGQIAAGQIRRALVVNGHQVTQYSHEDGVAPKVLAADIVFAGGEPSYYLPLLRSVREARPTMPFIIVAQVPKTGEWIDGLEAGATDYCSAPFDARQLHWMMGYTRPRPLFIPVSTCGRGCCPCPDGTVSTNS